MIEISIDGNAAEGFAGRIDYATYQYFEENGISMSDYSRQVDGDDLSEEDKIEIKEEFISKALEDKTNKEDDQIQLDFSAIGKDNLIKELSEVDILSLNPMEAMNRLYALVKEAKTLI